MLQLRTEKESALVEQITLLDPKTPMSTARHFVERHYMGFDNGALVPILHQVGGHFLLWNGDYFERLSADAIRAAVWRFLENAKRVPNEKERRAGEEGPQPFQPTTAKVNDVINALKAVTHFSGVLGAEVLPPPERRYRNRS